MSIAETTRPHLVTREAAAARIEALEFELKAAKSETEIADSVIEQKQARIEALETALRAVLEVTSESDTDVAWLTTLQQLAHATLYPEPDE